MDEATQHFLRTFQAFLDGVVAEARQAAASPGRQVVELLDDHLGTSAAALPVVSEELPGFQLVNLDLAMEAIEARHGGSELAGVGGGEQRKHHSLGEIVDMSQRWRQFPVAAVDYSSVATGPDSQRQVISFGLRLLSYDGQPVAVLQRGGDPRRGTPNAMVEVLTPADGVAARLLDDVRRLVGERSVFRGQVLSMSANPFEPGVGGITFHRRARLAAPDVVLPAGTLEKIERHVVGIGRHRARMRSAGQHLKRGVLLYGPPGTGKTHTVRYLTAALTDTTVVLLSGTTLQHVGTAAELARALQPAVVVLEDCDLIAEDRDVHPGAQPLLFEVLDALDGMADDADIAFVLTTNRADLLEPALSQRPGRVDLAVEIPLPDLSSRRRLLHLYARDLPLSPQALDDAAARTEGTTASLAKELLRRAVLVAADRDAEVGDDDLRTALTELLGDTEHLTRSLLGSRAARVAAVDGPRPDVEADPGA